ncbi:hypothetical protein [Chryseobacterium sp.]|uniref:hypothetical protein n=1 Tax=Chryseobacterium sp. TaxID=1871047 RepID=UPI0026269FB5|nr:hypothetical protein [Chryseobacterium sp.]
MGKKFQIIESEVNWPIAYLALCAAWLVTVIIAALILLLFCELFNQGFNDYYSYHLYRFFIILITEIVCIIISIFLIPYMINIKEKEFQKVVINEKGVYVYNYSNKIITRILYTELFRSDDSFLPDVRSVTNTQPSFTKSIKIFKKNESGQIQETGIGFNYGIYILKNKYDLYRHFLIGVQNFRPDLKIEQQTLEEYNLSAKARPVQKSAEFEFFITIILLALIFCLLYSIVLVINFLI